MPGNRAVNKRGVAVSVVLMITGALLVIATSVNAILRSSAEMYEDVASFAVDFGTGSGSFPFRWQDKERLSLWLALPERSIEGKDVDVQVDIADGAGERVARLRRNFRTATLRGEAGERFYYRLGSYKFFDDFDGRIGYRVSGDWRPETGAQLVLRRNQGTLFTTNEVVLVIIGGLVLMLGLGTLFRAVP